MAIYGIFGGLGSGKTLTFSFLRKHFFLHKEILANVHLNYPHTFMDMELIYDKGKNDTDFFKDKVLFIDEIHLLMESRRSSASVNVDFSQNILIQLGKLDCTFIYTSQLLSQVDLRIRQMTKYFLFVRKVDYNFNPITEDQRIIVKPILIDVDVVVLHSDTSQQTSNFTYVPDEFFKLYDTREIISFDRDKFLKK